ncbi:unnamed protein product [Cylindrotheca closterium]|uniref:Uncharacterized protein n=1 Tax=Cylindrotheca closterium TaxID=2856 RepID=A0AAD2FTZ7_9STRA|nr:unnamed protein product [Cylindrotheca closterium]
MESSTVDDPLLWTICYWIVSALNYGASILCLFVFVSIMSNPKTRTNAFNLYVGFMIFPDSLYAMTMGFLYLSKALGLPLFPPYEVTVYVYFLNFLVNFYSNGVVVHEINKLIQQSNNRQRTQLPDISRVYKQMAAVYLYGVFLATWAILPVSWSLYHIIDQDKGEGDLGSPPGGPVSRLAAIAIAYGSVIIPTGYVIYVSIRVWRKKLLPRKGKTRTLSLFFMRVIIVFVVFYFPNTATTVLQSGMETASGIFWIRVVRGLLAAGQVYTTIYLISRKDDIRRATIEAYNKTFGTVCCKLSYSNGSGAERGSVRVSGFSMGPSEIQRNSQVSTNPLPTSYDHPPASSERNIQSEWEAEDEYDNLNSTGKSVHEDSDKGNNASDGGDDEEGPSDSRVSTINMAGQVNSSVE